MSLTQISLSRLREDYAEYTMSLYMMSELWGKRCSEFAKYYNKFKHHYKIAERMCERLCVMLKNPHLLDLDSEVIEGIRPMARHLEDTWRSFRSGWILRTALYQTNKHDPAGVNNLKTYLKLSDLDANRCGAFAKPYLPIPNLGEISDEQSDVDDEQRRTAGGRPNRWKKLLELDDELGKESDAKKVVKQYNRRYGNSSKWPRRATVVNLRDAKKYQDRKQCNKPPK